MYSFLPLYKNGLKTPFTEGKSGMPNLWVNGTRDIIQDRLHYTTKRKQTLNPSSLGK